ncbi:MAG TPA: thiolase family protein [Planctomycetota bacterium]|nr:thiolase family protein [Planctomycetota bacterium]
MSRLAVFAGVRTPFGKAGGALRDLYAEDLAALAIRELILRTGVDAAALDGVVVGNVGQGARAANVARVAALLAGVPHRVPAWTVHRNCASGFEAVSQAADQLAARRGRLWISVGVESMSNYPLEYGDAARAFFERLSRAKTAAARLRALSRWRPTMLKPRVALLEGLRDPVAGLGMGQTAELLAREWNVTREEQDAFAAESHRRALAAREKLREETCDVVSATAHLRDDEGVRTESTPERLARLKPVFERSHGTVTAGNSSQVTDGAVALLVGDDAAGRAFGLAPLGYVERFAYAALEPERMGLGPAYAIDRLYDGAEVPWSRIDLVEINEAFAAQVLACLRAASDAEWCREELGRGRPLGPIPTDRLNVNGGAIALGHPVGASGARLILTSLLELRRRNAERALVSLCVGGGQGGAFELAVS